MTTRNEREAVAHERVNYAARIRDTDRRAVRQLAQQAAQAIKELASAMRAYGVPDRNGNLVLGPGCDGPLTRAQEPLHRAILTIHASYPPDGYQTPRPKDVPPEALWLHVWTGVEPVSVEFIIGVVDQLGISSGGRVLYQSENPLVTREDARVDASLPDRLDRAVELFKAKSPNHSELRNSQATTLWADLMMMPTWLQLIGSYAEALADGLTRGIPTDHVRGEIVKAIAELQTLTNSVGTSLLSDGGLVADRAFSPGTRRWTNDIRALLKRTGEVICRLDFELSQGSTMLDVARWACGEARTLKMELQAKADELCTARNVNPDPVDGWVNRDTTPAAHGNHDAIDRAAERAAAKAVEAMETRDAPGIGGTDTDWKDVQGLLLAKRDRDEPYTSLRKLCRELKCSDATIRKAIDKSATLKGWQARSAGAKAAPKATDLGAVVRDNARQTTEPAPDDLLPDDDIQATMARLIDQAKPDERAKLNALDDAGRRALVATYQSQNLDDELSPLEPDKPGARPRKVLQHKRA